MKLVIGCGNPWRGDDGAGLAVAGLLQGRPLADVRVLVCAEVPLDLCERWGEGDEVVLLDAARSDSPPGTIHRLDALAAPLPLDLLRISTHGQGLGQAVELARVLGRLPASLVVLGIEGERFAPGEGLSPAVAQAVDRLVEELGACTRPG